MQISCAAVEAQLPIPVDPRCTPQLNSSLCRYLVTWVPVKGIRHIQYKSMDTSIWVLEYVFLSSSTIYVAISAFRISLVLGFLYCAFILSVLTGLLKLRPVPGAMVFGSPLAIFNAFFYFTILLSKISYAQSPDTDTAAVSQGGAIGTATETSIATVGSATVAIGGTTTTFRPIFTVPAAADIGATLIPNINDPEAIDAQTVCPGYTASNVARTPYGLTAILTLAGEACNVYGTDVDTLNLTVEYQSADRLSVKIVPSYIDASNTSHFILPDRFVHQPTLDSDAASTSLTNDLNFVWNNEPTFSFSVYRVSTGDMLFSTSGTKLVFENQFVEFASALPENYNLYGLGETIHGLRLGNNFTKVSSEHLRDQTKTTKAIADHVRGGCW